MTVTFPTMVGMPGAWVMSGPADDAARGLRSGRTAAGAGHSRARQQGRASDLDTAKPGLSLQWRLNAGTVATYNFTKLDVQEV